MDLFLSLLDNAGTSKCIFRSPRVMKNDVFHCEYLQQFLFKIFCFVLFDNRLSYFEFAVRLFCFDPLILKVSR